MLENRSHIRPSFPKHRKNASNSQGPPMKNRTSQGNNFRIKRNILPIKKSTPSITRLGGGGKLEITANEEGGNVVIGKKKSFNKSESFDNAGNVRKNVAGNSTTVQRSGSLLPPTGQMKKGVEEMMYINEEIPIYEGIYISLYIFIYIEEAVYGGINEERPREGQKEIEGHVYRGDEMTSVANHPRSAPILKQQLKGINVGKYNIYIYIYIYI